MTDPDSTDPRPTDPETTDPAGSATGHAAPVDGPHPVHPLHVDVDSPDDMVGTPEAPIGSADVGEAAHEIEVLGTHDPMVPD
jgi:hypothetical protein